MKRVFLLFFALLTFLGASNTMAQKETANSNTNAVSLVSFIQDRPYGNATISIRNNLDIPITSIKARIVYKDMNGEVLDYQDIERKIDIAPKMSRTFNIKSFGDNADYVYYKSKNTSLYDRKFKVDFVLQGYNDKVTKQIQKDDTTSSKSIDQEDDNAEDMNSFVDVFATFIGTMVGFGIVFLLLILIPYKMAKKRNRNPWFYIFLSFLLTPFLVYAILAILDKKEN